MLFRQLLINYVYKYISIFSIAKKNWFYKILKCLFIAVFIIPFAILSSIGLLIDMILVIPSYWPVIGFICYIITKVVNFVPWLLHWIIMIPDAIFKTEVYDIYVDGLSLVGEDDIIQQ